MSNYIHMVTCKMSTLGSATAEEEESSNTPAMTSSELSLPVTTTLSLSNNVLEGELLLLLVGSNNPA